MTIKRKYLVIDSHSGAVSSRHNTLKGAVRGKHSVDSDKGCSYGVIIVRDVEGSRVYCKGRTHEGYRDVTESENDEAEEMYQEFNQYGW